jgi:hypothetical protein
MPTKDELMKLVVCSDGKYRTDGACINYANVAKPTINSTYFPNTVSSGYWSSSPFADFSGYAWNGDFNNGGSNYYFKNGNLFVRLVREETPPTTTAYTKISNTGVALPDTAILGSGSNDWACTKDNKTGLTWEVKTDDGGLRDKDWTYSWYKPSGDNGGFAGYTDTTNGTPNCSTQNNCNTDAFTNAVNTQGLCGKKDWRMPTKDELEGLFTKTSAVNQTLNVSLYINANYFPNTNFEYWSSSPLAVSSNGAWYVGFYGGVSYGYGKGGSSFVRMVR